MKEEEVLKGFSIEELEERSEFIAAEAMDSDGFSDICTCTF